jgi:hypothetical protein
VSQEIAQAKPAERIMDNWAVGKLIDGAARHDGTKASLKAELCEVAAELAGPSPSPIERMLAEAAATAWFAYRFHEANSATKGADGGISIAQADHVQRRLDRAHRRLLGTLKTLAAVRRLAVPALQINVAQRQQIAQLNGGGSS